MSDLTAAIEAAAEALHQPCVEGWSTLPDLDGETMHDRNDHRPDAELAIAAAAPHIRAAERERIARMLEQLADLACTGVENGTLRCAARLARSIPPEDIPGVLTERQT